MERYHAMKVENDITERTLNRSYFYTASPRCIFQIFVPRNSEGRSCILFYLIENNNEEIVALEVRECGAPYVQASKTEILIFARRMKYYAVWADKIHGMKVPADRPYKVHTLHGPIGMVRQIAPCNFPLLMITWKIGLGLLYKSTVVLKDTGQILPTTSLAIDLLYEVGFPSGVLNVTSGYGPKAAAAEVSHMLSDKPAFNGKVVLQATAKSKLKPVTLELGEKSPFIVCEDANVDWTVEHAHLALGKSDDEQGLQFDQEQFYKISRHIKDGKEENAALVARGKIDYKSISDEEWKKRLSREQYEIARKKGTERPFAGEYCSTKMPGIYQCVCCDTPLFDSETKFDSGTGWPSYFEPIGNNVKTETDFSIIFMPRQEVLCAICNAHLGHVFEDGPPPTGKRYCINSASLKMKPK